MRDLALGTYHFIRAVACIAGLGLAVGLAIIVPIYLGVAAYHWVGGDLGYLMSSEEP